MSNKKVPAKKPVNNTKSEKNTAPVQKKMPVAAVVIAAVAVAVIITTAVVGYFHWNEHKNVNIKQPEKVPVVPVESGDSKYELAQYKGTKLPVEFVEILNQAEQDNYNLCEKNGVVLTLGERNISIPEFVMYYYDVYYFQTESAIYSIQQTGANRTGYDLETLPRDQKYIREEYTWAEQFTVEVIDSMALNYMMFDEAVENGVELSDAEIAELMEVFDYIEQSAERNQRTPDEELAATYCEGLTAAMYNAREIVVALATKYDGIKLESLSEGYSEDVVKTEFENNPDGYKVAKLRIYPIEGDYIESEAGAVRTEKDLIEYANKNHPRETYDAEYSTDCGYITKTRVSEVYGDEVAEWAFRDGRRAGDISVVQGMLFRYIVYVETPAFYTTSCDIIFVGSQYDETMTLEDRAKIFKEEEEKYLKWKNEDGTKEGFLEYSNENGGVGQETIRLGDYQFQLDKWIFDPARKSGDHAIIDTMGGCGAVYYVENHADEYDWEVGVRSEMAMAELKDYQYKVLTSEYKAARRSATLNKAYDIADISIKNHQKRLENTLSQYQQ